jgi:integrase
VLNAYSLRLAADDIAVENSVLHGVDIKRPQQVLGHSNINTTSVYLQSQDKDLPKCTQTCHFSQAGVMWRLLAGSAF